MTRWALVLLVGWCGVSQAQTYTMTELAPLNAKGIASPFIVGEEAGLPVRLDLRTGQKQTLGHLGAGGVAQAVLVTGEAVGQVSDGQTTLAAFWDEAGTLFLLPGGLPSSAQSLNANWTTAGAGNCGGQQVPKRWYPAQGVDECLVLAPMLDVVGVDGGDFVWTTINNRVTVFGINGAVFDLGPGRFKAVNTQGQAVIQRPGPQGSMPWIGSLTEPFQPLPVADDPNDPYGGTYIECVVASINHAGAVLGSCGHPNAVFPYLWLPDGQTVKLPIPSGSAAQRFARAMDDAGLIVLTIQVLGVTTQRTVLLTPTSPRVAQCGNGVAHCQCGDTVIANYNMVADLTCAVVGTEAALVMAPGMILDGGGQFAVIGTGDGTGVLFDQAQGSRVQNVAVTGFNAGLKARAGASDNVLKNVVAWGNKMSLFFEVGNRNMISKSQLYGDAGVAVQLVDSHQNVFNQTCKTGEVVLQNSEARQTKRLPECQVVSR